MKSNKGSSNDTRNNAGFTPIKNNSSNSFSSSSVKRKALPVAPPGQAQLIEQLKKKIKVQKIGHSKKKASTRESENAKTLSNGVTGS